MKTKENTEIVLTAEQRLLGEEFARACVSSLNSLDKTKDLLNKIRLQHPSILKNIVNLSFNGKPLLMHAAYEKNDMRLAEFLLENKADVNGRDRDGWTTLMWVAYVSRMDAVSLLLKKGADVNAQNNAGVTVLMKTTNHPGISKLLLDNGANVNAQDYMGKTALMRTTSNHYTDGAELLLKRGAKVDAQDKKGETALMKAVGNVKLVKLLLDNGANVDARDNEGGTALMKTIPYDYVATARILLERGADANTQDNNGWTALMQAARNGDDSTEVASLLLKKGADVNVQDNEDKTALMKAVARFWGKTVDINTVSLLLKKGADVNAQDNEGRTALMQAAESGNLDVVKCLLNYGADVRIKVNENVPEHGGCTARQIAEKNNNSRVVELLKKREEGTDILFRKFSLSKESLQAKQPLTK